MKDINKPGLLVADSRLLAFAAPLSDQFTIIDGDGPLREAAIRNHGDDIIAILTTGHAVIDADLLDRLPRLQRVVAASSGTERIDLEAMRARGITLTSAAGENSEDVADHAVVLMLTARQQVRECDHWVRSGRWARDGMMQPRRSLGAERVGIVGMGFVGRAVARKIAPFCPEIGWWGPRSQDLPWPRHDSLVALAQWSSILILCARGDLANSQMITAEVINAIGPEGLFVNIARGALVDEHALITALGTGQLGQAALDVFSAEPTDPALWRDIPNALLSPHAASITREGISRALELTTHNLRSLLTGAHPRRVVIAGRAETA